MEVWKKNLYALWVSQVFCLMGFGLVMPFIAFYLEELGAKDTETLKFMVGLSTSIPAATMAIFAPVWGRMADKLGRKMMVLRATLCAGVFLGAMGLVRSAVTFLVLRGLQGVFTGTITASMAFVAANTPESRRSYSLGLISSSNFIGYSVGPVLGGVLADAVGYRVSFFIAGGMMLLSTLLVWKVVVEDPNTYGKALEHKSASGEGIDVEREGKPKHLINSFIICMFCVLFLNRLCRSVFSPYMALYIQEVKGSMEGVTRITGILSGVICIASAVSSVTLTRLGDRYNKYKVLMALTGISLPIALALILKTPLPLFIMIFGLFSFVVGAIEPLLTAASAEQIPTEAQGFLFGWMGTVTSLALMISPMIGAFVSVGFGYGAILDCIAGFLAIQLVFLIIKYRPAGKDALQLARKDSLH